MATIKDIANMIGVSTATVSNVLNGKAGAAGPAKTREIFEIAKKLQYTPNSLAKGLKQQKTNNIGIITEDLTVFNTPEIVDGIDAYCEENGYEIILGNMRLYKKYSNDFTDTPQHKKLIDDMVSNMLAKQVEGIVYVGCHCREISYIPTMMRVPFSYAYCYPQQEFYPSVLFDDKGAAAEVAELLINLGHKKIGVITGPENSYHTIQRLLGFQEVLHDKGIFFDSSALKYGDWERSSGYRNTDALLDLNVSAIFAFNDIMASGVYERCIERGIVIGKDLSLFGFDNREISRGYSPRISTVEPPLNKIGRKSAQMIIKQINGKRVASKPMHLECKILKRNSVGEANY